VESAGGAWEEGDIELAKLAGWSRQCLHPGNERLGALLILLAAQRPETGRRNPQLANAESPLYSPSASSCCFAQLYI